MRTVKELKDEMDKSFRDEFKELDGQYSRAWTLRLLLEIIERMDERSELTYEEALEQTLPYGGNFINGPTE